MLRLLAAAAVFALCALFGAVRAESIRLRLRLFDELERDLASIETSLKLEHADASAVIGSLAGHGCRKELWSAMAEEMSAGSSFSLAWEHNRNMLTLDQASLAPLDAFAESFGNGDIETELTRTALARARFHEIAARERELLEGKYRAYRAVGALIGAAAALLVL